MRIAIQFKIIMAIQEGDTSAFLNLDPEADFTMQSRIILKDVLGVMQDNPDFVASSVDAAVEICADTVKKKPEFIPIITPIKAVSTYLESFVREPLVDAAGKYPDPAGEILGDISRGVFHLSNALAEVDGVLSLGVPGQVMFSLSREAQNLSPEVRSEFISKRREFRTYLAERRFGLYLKDPTGGRLVWQEYEDLIDLSKGISPYEGYKVNGNPINEIGVEGGSFVLNAYGMIYRCAREKLGSGIVVTQ